MSEDKEAATTEERVGQMYIYKDRNEVTKITMIGYDVIREEYDLMPDYLREHFERPSKEFDLILQDRDPNVFVIPEDVLEQIESTKVETT